MSKIVTPPTLATQTLMFHEVDWKDKTQAAVPTLKGPIAATGRPPGTAAGDPYWEFSWELLHDSGIRITNLVARDTLSSGSAEPVAERIDFTDFKMTFDDAAAPSPGSGDPAERFDMVAAFAHKESKFFFNRNGSRFTVSPNDDRFQYGLLLELVNDFGGRCKVTMRIAFVLRGKNNDFDPGNVPWAMMVYPQIGYTFQPTGSTARRVKQFRGSVRVTVNNQITGMIHGMTPPAENVANFYADSNNSMLGDHRVDVMADGSTANPTFQTASMFVHEGKTLNKPFGWGMVFDYNRLDVQQEEEYPAVYGPDTSVPWAKPRSRHYFWPQKGAVKLGDFRVFKVSRQGGYDNIHLHARMPQKDGRGNEQYHAPFCGHSCVHMHWRWSAATAAGAADDRGWQFRGWSYGPTAQAHTSGGEPLVPHNQKVSVALCIPTRTRLYVEQILGPTIKPLDPLHRMIWYCVDIFHVPKIAPLNANEQQVIMEHGLGWGYRYSTPKESNAVLALKVFLNNSLPGSPTQDDLMKFFEEKIYPAFRYWDSRGIVVNQVPDGGFDDVESGGAKVKLHDL